MSEKTIIDVIDNQKWLDEVGAVVQPAVIKAFESGGNAGKALKNFLHGTWLGHPLHPVLTDVPIGAWTVAAILDGMELAGEEKYASGADAAIGIGLAGAAGAAVAGLTDWTGTTQKKRRLGLMHGLLNIAATGLYLTSILLRRKRTNRKTAIAYSMAGYGIMTAAAYLGGHLVFAEQIGVDHTATSIEYPEEFVAVLPENELAENSMKCAQAGEVPVVLARKNGRIYALANTCSHLGGPLCEGELLDGGEVRCPWHGSVFSFVDGSVVEGPATESQPAFDVRIVDGQIELRRKKS